MKTTKSFMGSLMVAPLLLLGAWAHAQSVEGVSKTNITLGQSVPLTGQGASLAVPFHLGAKLYFDRVNAAGGVNGRKIDLVTMDGAGVVATTSANTAKFVEQGVLALFGYYGSPQVTAAYASIKDTDLLMFAPMAAADEFQGALYPNIFSIRPGYSEEAAVIVKHAETLGAKKLVILHGSDSESLAALDAAVRTMTSSGANLLARTPLEAVDKAVAPGPQSVLVIGDPDGAANAIRGLRAKGFRGPIYAFSNAGESLLADRVGPAGAGVVVARVVPKSDHAKMAVVRELLADAAQAKAGKPNVYMLEGYIAARTFTEALRRVPGKELNRAKLRKSIEALDNLSIGGFRMHFVEERTGSKLVELSLIDSQGKVRE